MTRRSGGHRGRTLEQTQVELKRLKDEVERLRRPTGHPRAAASLHHEISVYQEELVIQNEALVTAQASLEETRDRFIDLYDFAPTGYLTLDANGVVRECNLTAAAMIGKSKSALEGCTLVGLVAPDDRTLLMRFLQRCRSGKEEQIESVFLIRTADGPRYMHFLCRIRTDGDGPPQLLASLVDVTERRQIERERMQMAEEHAALAGRLLAAHEDERSRIARNLHDDLGQQATALRLRLEHLAADPVARQLRSRILQLLESMSGLDASLHQISAGLRPSALDLGIVPAIRHLVYDWSASSAVATALHADDIGANWLAPDVETHVFRILQEALNNVAKHASATRVTVVLKRLPTAVSLVIEDNGRGFDVEAVRAANGALGLVSMRERVQLVGGKLEIKSTERQGTAVSLTVPRHVA